MLSAFFYVITIQNAFMVIKMGQTLGNYIFVCQFMEGILLRL
jgi:hypothetical protein